MQPSSDIHLKNCETHFDDISHNSFFQLIKCLGSLQLTLEAVIQYFVSNF